MWKVYLSRALNFYLLGGKKNQMLSSRAYVEHWIVCEKVINALFFWHEQHCRRAFLWEVKYEAHQSATRKAQEASPSDETYPALLEAQTEGGDL